MRALPLTLALLAASLSAGCNDFGFEQFSEVTKLRTLAIRLQPPELAPGTTVRMDSLSVDPRTDAPLAYEWEVCAFDDGPDGGYECVVDDDGQVLGVVIASTPTAELAYDDVVAFLGTAEQLCEALADADIPDFVEVPDCERGFPLTVRLVVRNEDGETETSVKRLLLLDEDVTPNAAPTIDGLLVDGRPVPDDGTLEVPFTDEAIPLQVLVDPAQAESYEDGEGDTEEDPTVEREQLSVTWFSTHGAIERDTTYFFEPTVSGAELQTNEIELGRGNEAAPGDRVRLWAVVRDNRGGTDWIERTVRVGDAEDGAN